MNWAGARRKPEAISINGMAEIQIVLTGPDNRDNRGALWRRVAAGGRTADMLSQGRIGRLWGGNAGRSILHACTLRMPRGIVFGKHCLLRSGVFSLLRRRGFSLSPERYLRRSPLSPVQITLTRNGAAVHHGRSLPRPLSVVNNTTSHKTWRHLQFNRQFNRQWHYHRQLNVISHIGLAAPVLRGIAALHLMQDPRRSLLRMLGQAPASNGLLENTAGRFLPNVDLPAIAGLTGVARLAAHTLYSKAYSKAARAVPTLGWSRALLPHGAGVADDDRLRDTLITVALTQQAAYGIPATRKPGTTYDGGLHRHVAWRAAPLLRMSRLTLPARLPGMAGHIQRRSQGWQVAAAYDMNGHQGWLSPFAVLSPLSASRLRPSAAAAGMSQRAAQGIASRLALLSSNDDKFSGKRSGFILAARDSAGLPGFFVALRSLARNTGGLRDKVISRAMPGSLRQRRQSGTLSEHGRLVEHQQMRAQHAIAELCRNQERQRQEFHLRDERVFNELRQQLQALQRSGSNEQAALLKAVQSLERALTQSLKTASAPALRPLSFMGNR